MNMNCHNLCTIVWEFLWSLFLTAVFFLFTDVAALKVSYSFGSDMSVADSSPWPAAVLSGDAKFEHVASPSSRSCWATAVPAPDKLNLQHRTVCSAFTTNWLLKEKYFFWEKLLVSQLVKKFYTFNATSKTTTGFVTAEHWTIPWNKFSPFLNVAF